MTTALAVQRTEVNETQSERRRVEEEVRKEKQRAEADARRQQGELQKAQKRREAEEMRKAEELRKFEEIRQAESWLKRAANQTTTASESVRHTLRESKLLVEWLNTIEQYLLQIYPLSRESPYYAGVEKIRLIPLNVRRVIAELERTLEITKKASDALVKLTSTLPHQSDLARTMTEANITYTISTTRQVIEEGNVVLMEAKDVLQKAEDANRKIDDIERQAPDYNRKVMAERDRKSAMMSRAAEEKEEQLRDIQRRARVINTSLKVLQGQEFTERREIEKWREQEQRLETDRGSPQEYAQRARWLRTEREAAESRLADCERRISSIRNSDPEAAEYLRTHDVR